MPKYPYESLRFKIVKYERFFCVFEPEWGGIGQTPVPG